MNSSQHLPAEKAEGEGNEQASLLTMNGLFLLDLSTALQQAHEEGMLKPEVDGEGQWVFKITMCPTHQMITAPKCPICTN
jgi:hypothetical protein